jgi:nucleoside-diphosphate-sugar epimerase
MSSTTLTPDTKVLALITGGSGFVGAAIALRFLEQGHSVRLPLRKQEQADAWLSEYGSKYEGKIETLILEKTITDEGVFDEAVKGVDVVVHAASPAKFDVEVRFPSSFSNNIQTHDLHPLRARPKTSTSNPPSAERCRF